MKRIKRIAHVIAFVCLIFLAGIGIGISGGVPIPLTKTRRDSEKENTELLEQRKNQSNAQQDQFKT